MNEQEQAVQIRYRDDMGYRHTIYVAPENILLLKRGEALVVDTTVEPIDIRRIQIGDQR